MSLEEVTPEQAKRWGWALMVLGKCADLAVTWYALVTIPIFIEGNPLPAVAYARYGILGLVVLNGLAILFLTIVVELGDGILIRKEKWNAMRALTIGMGYWVPGMAWVLIAARNGNKVQMAASYGF